MLLLIFLSSTLLCGCTNKDDENLAISCVGDKVIRKKNGVSWDHVANVKHSYDYNFVNKKLDSHDCSWSNNGITCLVNHSLPGFSMSIVVVIDREKGDVWESYTISYENGDGKSEIFTGKCEKLFKKF